MKKTLAKLALALTTALGAAGCQDVVTEPNTRDPNGPQVNTIVVCYIVNNQCVISSNFARGAGFLLEVDAITAGQQNITDQCAFKWDSNRASVRIAVNNPSNTAVVTVNQNAPTGSMSITATCNGVSGNFTVQVL